MYRHDAQYYTLANRGRFEQLTTVQRELMIAFVCPNGEALTSEGIIMFFSLLDSNTIEFAQSDTPNEHLHVPHHGKPHGQWCLTCEHIERTGRLVAA